MTRHDPDVTRIVIDEEDQSIIPRRRENGAKESTVEVATTVIQISPITRPHPVEAEITTMSTRDRSVEENRTTNSDRSRKRKVDREGNTAHADPVTRNHHGT